MEFKKEYKIKGETLTLENYGKGYVIYGNPEFQKEHKEDYKTMGGRYNPNLSVGKGWIFGSKRLEELKTYLDKHTD